MVALLGEHFFLLSYFVTLTISQPNDINVINLVTLMLGDARTSNG
jgi:hypothetical protein